MKISLGYCTSRPDPKLEWMIETLRPQLQRGDQVELVLIDALLGAREVALERIAREAGVFTNVLAAAPMPNIWQGPHRVTSRDWWALGRARDTAFVIASHDYIAFVDDRCRLGPRWLDVVRRGARERASVLSGSYEKIVFDPNVINESGPNGKTITSQDSRRTQKPEGLVNCGGGWCFGCTFALPLEWALEVNGHEAGCDGLSGEDYILGLMLGNRGRRIDFVPDMFISLERPVGTEHTCRRIDKGTSPDDKSHAAITRFASRKRTELTPDLRAIRTSYRRTGVAPWPIPDPQAEHRDWYDGQLIREMV